MDKIKCARQIIGDSQYLVCLQGICTSIECGCTSYRNQKTAYEMEEKYGYSPEEMFNASFFNTRTEQFFDYYRNEVLGYLGDIGPSIRALKELEDKGYLKAIVTREIYHLARRAGCENVSELHGNVYTNFCPKCKTEYSMEEILNARGIPRCSRCNTVIRPGVRLVGEMIDNGVMTQAATQVGAADVLLIVGCNMNNRLAEHMVKYFEGDKIILIHEEEHHLDQMADLVIQGKPKDILPLLVP